MALTNYLLQSVFLNVLFFWYGLDLWDSLSRAAVVAIVCGLFALQALTSALWLRAFAAGPTEWLWRRLTYGRPLPFRRDRAAV